MFGLIYENFLILKRQILMASILLALSIIPSVMFNDYIFFIFSTILVSMLPITACVYENDSKMIKVLLAMPISRVEFVLAKYISTFLLSAIGFVINLVYMLIRGKAFNLSLVLSLSCFLIGTTIMNVMFPLVFKYGVEKAKFLLVCIFIILAAIVGPSYEKIFALIDAMAFWKLGVIVLVAYFIIFAISIIRSTLSYYRIDIN